jgi:hypothetical protein
MNLSHLLSDAQDVGDVKGDFQVLLATRSLDGVDVPPDEVNVRAVGRLQVDLSGEEVDILPVCFMDPEGPALRVADFRSLAWTSPELGSYMLTGVIGFKQLEDGSTAQRTCGIVGTYVLAEDRQIWLLLRPEDQWPEEWFVEPSR